MMLVWALFYQLTVGTIAYSLVAELSTRRLQIKTVVLGRNAYNVVGKWDESSRISWFSC